MSSESEQHGPTTIDEIESELKKLPPAAIEAFDEAKWKVNSAFSEEEVVLWAREGLTIANQTVRSWEAAVEYFSTGPEVARFLPFPAFMQWARCGTYLSQDSTGRPWPPLTSRPVPRW